jgi:hypothetical protein
MNATTIEISSSHVPIVSHRSRVAAFIRKAAERSVDEDWGSVRLRLNLGDVAFRRLLARRRHHQRHHDPADAALDRLIGVGTSN